MVSRPQEPGARAGEPGAGAAPVERAHLASLQADVGLALVGPGSLRTILQGCAGAILRHLDAAFVRIWTLDATAQMLELQASVGLYTHLDGPHGRVPVGNLKIGLIAAERRPHLTNRVTGDPRIADQAWAAREGMVAFAGYPLLVADRLVGVAALFARHPLAEAAMAALAAVAHTIALGIERKRGEEALRESEANYRLLAGAVPAIVWRTDADGVPEYYNERWYDYTGLTEAETIGGWPAVIHPDDLPEVAASWEAARAAGGSWERAYRLRRRDGAYRWHLGRSLPVRGEDGAVRRWFGSATDIDDQRRLQDELARQLNLMATITANATLGLFLMDARQHCTFMNAAAERITGFTLAEVQGRPLHEFVHHTRPDGTPYPLAACPIDRALPERNRMQGEETFVHKDGRFYPVAFTASPIVEDGLPVGTVIEVEDITERRRLYASERAALRAAEAALRARDEFLATISHDLRTPLGVIKGLAQVVLRQAGRAGPFDAARVAEALATIDRSATKMDGMIGDLLDLAQLDAARPPDLDRRPTDLVPLVREIASVQADGTGPHAIEVEAAVATIVGNWDPARLERVVSNLLSNAVKYSPDGGVIRVTLRQEPGDGRAWAILTVQDQGIGIPAADLPRIFERFHRAANVAGAIPGIGLGLAGSKQIVEQHGGTIAIESAEGAGTTVTVRLPVAGGEAPPDGADDAGG